MTLEAMPLTAEPRPEVSICLLVVRGSWDSPGKGCRVLLEINRRRWTRGLFRKWNAQNSGCSCHTG